MRDVVFFHKKKSERELYIFDWESRYDVQVCGVDNEQSALNKLNELQEEINEQKKAPLEEKKNSLENIIFIADDVKNKIEWSLEFRKFLEVNPQILVVNKLGESVDKLFLNVNIVSHSDPYREYFKIKLPALDKFKIAPVAFYIKVGFSKYIKVINEGDDGLEKIVEHYLLKGSRYFFVKKTEYEKMMVLITKELVAKFNAPKLDPQKVKDNINESLENINQSLMGIGFGPEHLGLVNKVTDAVLNEVQKVGTVWKSVEEKLSASNYLTGHSLAMAIIGCAISTYLNSSSDQIREKIVLASLFHDIYLDEGRLVYMSNIQIMTDTSLTTRERRELAVHSKEVIELLKNMPAVPPNVTKMILEHHEMPECKGVPGKLDAFTISPLACLLIIAEDFYHLCYQNGMNVAARLYALQRLKEVYEKGNFIPILKALEQLFYNELQED